MNLRKKILKLQRKNRKVLKIFEEVHEKMVFL